MVLYCEHMTLRVRDIDTGRYIDIVRDIDIVPCWVVLLTVISIIRDGLNKKFYSDIGWYCRIPIINFKNSSSASGIDTYNIVIAYWVSQIIQQCYEFSWPKRSFQYKT